MIGQVPRWLADPLGPLTISPAYLPRLLPWLWRFWRAGRASRYDESVSAQAALMKLSEAEWPALMERSGTGHMLREDGCLELYESEAEWKATLPGWAERERFGIAFRHGRGAELAELQPGLSERFVVGTYVPGWKTVSDPQHLGKAIWQYAEARGANFVRGEAVAAGLEGDQTFVKLADGARLQASRLVIAAGAWSHRLARHFGDRIPLETERGYNTTLPGDAFDVKQSGQFVNVTNPDETVSGSLRFEESALTGDVKCLDGSTAELDATVEDEAIEGTVGGRLQERRSCAVVTSDGSGGPVAVSLRSSSLAGDQASIGSRKRTMSCLPRKSCGRSRKRLSALSPRKRSR
jgi:glycine/D-amino acid oxidase-like deaminating enzyme